MDWESVFGSSPFLFALRNFFFYVFIYLFIYFAKREVKYDKSDRLSFPLVLQATERLCYPCQMTGYLLRSAQRQVIVIT